MNKTVKIAIAQMVSTDNLTQNLGKMKAWVKEAAEKGANMIVFPELAYLHSKSDKFLPEIERYSEFVGLFCKLAQEHNLYILPGSLREPVKGKTDRFLNTLPVISPNGEVIAEYRKIFLFQAKLSDRSYDETKYSDAGDSVCVVDTEFGKLGLSICFDLRFPELFRALKKKGAEIVVLPAAFTVPTGKVHWQPLLTARAIENQFFVLASGVVGLSGEGSQKYGHSLAISPWGEILTDMEEREGLEVVELPLQQISECETRLNVWACRREEVLPLSS